MTDEEMKTAVATLLAQHGNEKTALEAALRKSRRYFDKWKAAETEATALKAKVPADGSAVLPEADAKALEAYRALGKPDELKAALDEKATLAERVKKTDREALRRKVAEAEKADPDALAFLPGVDALAFEVEPVDGKPAGFVKAGDKRTRLREYVKTTYPKLEPTLFPAERQALSGGTPMIPMSSGGQAPKGTDYVAQALARNRAAADAPNPLKPAVPAMKGA